MKTKEYTVAHAGSRKEGYYAAFLFLVWPFLSVISALKNYDKGWAKNIFWAYCAYYGYVLAISAESQGMDIVGYIADVEYLHTRTMGVSEIISYFQNSGEIDILRTLLAYLVSRVTADGAILTLVYGAIFGFFLSRNLWFLLDRMEGKLVPVTLLLLTCFFLVNPVWQINTFRMWTATHIFIYGLLPFLFDGKKSGLFVSLLSILVHFSFIVPVGALFAYLILGNRTWIYFGFFIITQFITELNVQALNDFMAAYAPEILQERTRGYRSEDYMEEVEIASEDRIWFMVWSGKALKYSITAFLVVLFIKSRSLFEEHRDWNNLFSFTLLFYGVANVLSLLPSGGRYLTIAYLCALGLLALYCQNLPRERLLNRLVYLAFPPLLLYIVVSIRLGIYTTSASAVLGNPFIAIILSGEHLPLNDVLRMIL